MKWITFQNRRYRMVVTDHATTRMSLREVTEAELIETIERGRVKEKATGKWWVHRTFSRRDDNAVAAALVADGKDLIVITVMVNWEPT